jgi:hypothetical protein
MYDVWKNNIHESYIQRYIQEHISHNKRIINTY